MIKELEQLQDQLTKQATPSDNMTQEEFKAWLEHPYTKLFFSEVKRVYLTVLESIDDNVPTNHETNIEHAVKYGQREALESLLNYDPFE